MMHLGLGRDEAEYEAERLLSEKIQESERYKAKVKLLAQKLRNAREQALAEIEALDFDLRENERPIGMP